MKLLGRRSVKIFESFKWNEKFVLKGYILCEFCYLKLVFLNQGKDVCAIDPYVVATWHPPQLQDPFLSLPVSTSFSVHISTH